MYVVLEGIDGTGKDSQAALLAERLVGAQAQVVVVGEPDNDLPGGQELRALLKSGLYCEAQVGMFLANRMALHASKVLPALDAGKHVISARSFVSTLVYQQEQWPLSWLVDLHRTMLAKPDMIILLDLDATTALARVSRRSEASEMYERREVLARLRERYQEIIVRTQWTKELMAPNGVIFTVDASPSVDEVSDTIWGIVSNSRTSYRRSP